MDGNGIVSFDLSAFEQADPVTRRDLAALVDEICRDTGFLALGGHAIPAERIDDMWRATREFFDLDPEEKEAAAVLEPGYPYGYLGPGTEALAKSRDVDTPPDLKESFNGGPAEVPAGITDPDALAFCYAPTPWPQLPHDFVQVWRSYYSAMETLAVRIMRVFAAALELPEDYFTPLIDAPISALRALNYPHTATPPEPGQLRAGAHSDYGSLTILLPQAGTSGLQIHSRHGGWIEVPPIPGTFVVNIGDLMARWTNDRWVSTLHRVVNPELTPGSNRRQSLAFFHQPNWDAEISCIESCLEDGEKPKYEPVRSGPYLMSKFRSTVE